MVPLHLCSHSVKQNAKDKPSKKRPHLCAVALCDRRLQDARNVAVTDPITLQRLDSAEVASRLKPVQAARDGSKQQQL